MTARNALYRTVADHAAKAALEDPRFPPLERDALAGVRIEISALTPGRPLKDPGDLSIGRDGLHLRQGAASAVFLPQVAAEQGWSVDVFLRQLALKAGLPQEGWREADLSVFSAEVFHELDR